MGKTYLHILNSQDPNFVPFFLKVGVEKSNVFNIAEHFFATNKERLYASIKHFPNVMYSDSKDYCIANKFGKNYDVVVVNSFCKLLDVFLIKKSIAQKVI